MLTENERDILEFLDVADRNGEVVQYIGSFDGDTLRIVGGAEGPHCSNPERARLEELGYVERTPLGRPMYMRITAEGKAQI